MDRGEAQGWNAPGYWRDIDGAWFAMTLGGLRPVDPALPVCHVSYYEADAFARWAGKHLPSEAEWEVAAKSGALDDAFGVVWQWTRSAYAPYPGYRAEPGALGEYNGKFMVNQMVLRGSSLATPAGHSRDDLSQFLLSVGALAVQRIASGRVRTLSVQMNIQTAFRAPRPIEHASIRSPPTSSPVSPPSPNVCRPNIFTIWPAPTCSTALPDCRNITRPAASLRLLSKHAPAIASLFPPDCALIEFGSGSSRKARILLRAAASVEAYVPVDISGDFLQQDAAQVRRDFPHLAIYPVVADFTAMTEPPVEVAAMPRAGFFPGSTIGNFEPHEAAAFLRRAGRILGAGVGARGRSRSRQGARHSLSRL